MSFERFPYTNFHELNLDWVIAQMKETIAKAEQAIETAESYEEQIEMAQVVAEAARVIADLANEAAEAAQEAAATAEEKADAAQEAADAAQATADTAEGKADAAQETADTALEATVGVVRSVNSVLPNAQGALALGADDVPYQGDRDEQDVGSALDGLNDDLETASTSIASLEQGIETHEQRLDDLDTAVEGAESDIDTLEENVVALGQALSVLDNAAVKTVNGLTPAASGNVDVGASDVPFQNTTYPLLTDVDKALAALLAREPGDVSSVNGVSADSSGNVTLDASDIPYQGDISEATDIEGAIDWLHDSAHIPNSEIIRGSSVTNVAEAITRLNVIQITAAKPAGSWVVSQTYAEIRAGIDNGREAYVVLNYSGAKHKLPLVKNQAVANSPLVFGVYYMTDATTPVGYTFTIKSDDTYELVEV